MARRLLFTLLVLCLVAPAARGDEWDDEYPEPTPLPVLLRDLQDHPGALWYAARVRMPRGAAIEWVVNEVGVPDTRVIGEFSFLYDQAGERIYWGGGYGLREPDGGYAVVRQGDTEIALGDERRGMSEDEPSGGTSWSRWRQEEEDAAVIDLLTFPASDGAIDRTSITVRADKGVEVLAESWGQGGTEIAREWDLAGGTYARAGTPVPGTLGVVPDALVINDASLTRQIDRHMTSWFLDSALVPTWGRYAVTDPGGNVRHNVDPDVQIDDDSVRFQISDEIFTGQAPGAYTFTVEHFQDAAPVGASTYVLIVIADADFPACSTLRVRRHAPGGHPICG